MQASIRGNRVGSTLVSVMRPAYGRMTVPSQPQEESKMDKTKQVSSLLAGLAAALLLALAPTASAHNRAHLILPNGQCIIVGSEKSVSLPDGTLLDLDPYVEGDEIGTSFAALQGSSAIEKGPCP